MSVKVVKVGGSVITDKSKPFSIRRDVLYGIAREVSEYLKLRGDRIIIIHGGGSYGHYLVKECVSRKGFIDNECFARISFFMNELSTQLIKSLLLSGVPATLVPTKAVCRLSDDGLASCNLNVVRDLLNLKVTPVMHGDVVVASEGFKVLSGDVLAWLAARELGADTVVFLTDVDGVYSEDPRRNPNAELLREARLSELLEKASLTGSTGYDVTGGMEGKLRHAITYGVRGVKAVVTNGLVRGNLISSLLGRGFRGTVIWT